MSKTTFQIPMCVLVPIFKCLCVRVYVFVCACVRVYVCVSERGSEEESNQYM